MKKKLTLTIGVICWLLFVILLTGVVHHSMWINQIDQFGFQLLHPTFPNETQAMIVLTHLGDPIILQTATIILALYLWWQNRLNESLWYVFLQFIGYSLVILIKYNVLRIRPSNKLFPANGYSFPSGHTFATTIFVFTVLSLLLPYLHHQSGKVIFRIFGALWIVIIMATRVYLHDHFTSDVIGGLLLACGWWLIMNSFRHQLSQWLIKPITKIRL
ncbi:MAG: phosphatase PAP2 family protein [Limosilactobacillus sp.]|uniref:phosphatase PAP2 family protein n=1 Tax=Limosilactobacillus sp. TaxID=2773925 RepID=UPI0025B9CF8D|nr:phosphatase PAP2 family protein [Limosilactobacillus sp.]MCI1974536.1 phosphatase PAP2 family protein [Limosilactobacillus sp.]MCI2030611.1 phosphatase PAP2 family protein [Limosilactobacillus sp.]